MATVIDFVGRKRVSDYAEAVEIASRDPEYHSLSDEDKDKINLIVKRMFDSVNSYWLPNLDGLSLDSEQVEYINKQCITRYYDLVGNISWILSDLVKLNIQAVKRNTDTEKR